MTLPKVFIIGAAESAQVAGMFHRRGFQVVSTIKVADMVVFVGGSDIDTELYGEKPIPLTFNNDTTRKRDAAEIACFRMLSKEQIKIGICRGGQLLNVLNGGKMIQNVNNHNAGGGKEHPILIKGETTLDHVNSYHHQMMIPNFNDPTLEIIGVSAESTTRETEKGVWHGVASMEDDPDYEVLFYGDSNSFCFQPHPEWGTMTEHLFFKLMKKQSFYL